MSTLIGRRRLITAGILVLVVVAGLVARNQLKVQNNRPIRTNEGRVRQSLFNMLQPVALKNCELERFGEANDGGYLMCGNLLGDARVGYSYGIAGFDGWGCDISKQLNVPVHEYDCFDRRAPSCQTGTLVFHPECVDGITRTDNGRHFDTMLNQFARNGDSDKHVVLKVDVEGAEWDSFLLAPDKVLNQIDQMAVEFHGTDKDQYEAVVQRLTQFFYVAHIHFNNAACVEGRDPFPTWAYEVLFVSRRIGVVDESRRAGGLHPLDAPNLPALADCQPQADRSE